MTLRKMITKDSDDMRLAANHALQAHENTRVSAQVMVVNALACGFIMFHAKEALPHGEFGDWQKKYLADIPERTRARYLAFAKALADQGGASSSLLTVASFAPPGDLTQERVARIAPKIREATEGRTFTELGRDLGVFKPKNTKTERAKKKKRTGNKAHDHAEDAHEWVVAVCEVCADHDHHVDNLRELDVDPLVNALADTLHALGITPAAYGRIIKGGKS